MFKRDGFFRDNLRVKSDVVGRHPRGSETILKDFTTTRSVDIVNFFDHGDCRWDVFGQKTGFSMINQLGHRSKGIGDDGSATSHRFNQNQAKGFRPIDRKNESCGVAQKLLLFMFADFANKFDQRVVQQMLDLQIEIVLFTFVNLCGYLEPAPCGFGNFNCTIEALFRAYPAQETPDSPPASG